MKLKWSMTTVCFWKQQKPAEEAEFKHRKQTCLNFKHTNKQLSLYLGESYLLLPEVFQRLDQQITCILYLQHQEGNGSDTAHIHFL